jgi:hypothetical protein
MRTEPPSSSVTSPRITGVATVPVTRVDAAGDVGDVVAHGERAGRGEVHVETDAVLPRRRGDRRDAAAREDDVEQRLLDVELAVVERARDGDVAGDRGALEIAAEEQVEVALDGDAFVVAQRDVGALDGDARALRLIPASVIEPPATTVPPPTVARTDSISMRSPTEAQRR